MHSKLAKNTISSIVLKITTIICGFILPRLILQTYGSEINGLVNSISQFLGLIAFLELGVGAVVQSSLYKPLAERDNILLSQILSSAQKFFNRLGTILAVYVLLLIFVYPFIAKQNYGFIFTGLLIVAISISMFAQYFFGIVNMLLLNSDQRGYISFNVQTITLIVNTFACYVLINFDASIQVVKFATSVIFLARPVYLFWYVRKNYNIDAHIQYEGEPIKQKWNGVAQHASWFLINGVASIILTLFSTLSTVSVFSVYNLVVQGIKDIVMSFTGGIQPLIGEQWAKGELEKLKNTFAWTEWSIHTMTTLIFGITGILILPFVRVYTKGINDVNYILPIFAALIVVANAGHCYRLPYNIMILAGGHYKQTQSNYIVAAVANVVISVVCVKLFGIIGVSIGMLVAMIYQTIWMAYYDSKNFICWDMRYFFKQIFVDIVTVCGMVFCTWSFEMTDVSYNAWVVLAIKVSLVSLVVVCIINSIFYQDKVVKLKRKLLKV